MSKFKNNAFFSINRRFSVEATEVQNAIKDCVTNKWLRMLGF